MSIPKSCRLTEDDAERLAAAAEEANRLEDEIVREAIRYYMAANPHGYQAFRGVNSAPHAERSGAETHLGKTVYDPSVEDP